MFDDCFNFNFNWNIGNRRGIGGFNLMVEILAAIRRICLWNTLKEMNAEVVLNCVNR